MATLPVPDANPKHTRPDAWREIENLLGSEHVLNSTSSDVVDGVRPARVLEPGSAEEVARVLAIASSTELKLAPRGGGSKLEWGNPPNGLDAVVSTRRLNRVLEHAWSDMTASVEAGCTVAELQRTLAGHGQRLALDPLWPEQATIGGVLATNDSGALRTRFGSLRDLIIGITLALPDGTLAKSGGKVVKNVAGYDLPKLATGSFGTLGIITQAIFRLHPLPKETRTISRKASNIEVLNQIVLAAQASTLTFTGLQIRAGSGIEPQLDIRFAGVTAGIEAQARQFASLAAAAAEIEALPDAWSTRESLWNASNAAVVVKFSVLPSQIAKVAASAQRISGTNGGWRFVAQAAGAGLLRIEPQNAESLPAAVASLRTEVNRLGGSVVLLHSPLELKRRMNVWGYTGDALALMRRIKQQFDPAGTLNPGRFVGGI